MTTHIIARFADGRLLIQEQKLAAQAYYAGGIDVRMGLVAHIDHVLSVTTNLEQYGLATPLALVSSSLDVVKVRAIRADLPLTTIIGGSGATLSFSGLAALGLVSGLLSGIVYHSEVVSGVPVSGLLTVTVNAIGY